jgi:hypothetical protein
VEGIQSFDKVNCAVMELQRWFNHAPIAGGAYFKTEAVKWTGQRPSAQSLSQRLSLGSVKAFLCFVGVLRLKYITHIEQHVARIRKEIHSAGREHSVEVRGPFTKFVHSPYYSEWKLYGGAVTVSFSKCLPCQAMHFLQRSTHFSKTYCRPFVISKFLASELPFHGRKSPEIAWGEI